MTPAGVAVAEVAGAAEVEEAEAGAAASVSSVTRVCHTYHSLTLACSHADPTGAAEGHWASACPNAEGSGGGSSSRGGGGGGGGGSTFTCFRVSLACFQFEGLVDLR